MPNLKHPLEIVFLYPPGKNFGLSVKAAKHLRKVLEGGFKLKTFVVTTGSKGLHVVAPIKTAHGFEKVRAFAKEVGKLMIEEKPSFYTRKFL